MEGDSGTFVERLTQARDAIEARRAAVEVGHPWPLAVAFGTEPEASWGPPEVLAHVAEMLPFWLGEIERVIDGPTEPVPFGRVATDQLRIGMIERDRTLPPRELFARLRSGVDRYVERVPELSAADLGRRGLHATRGELTVEGILERFVVGHLEEHAVQLDEVLG